MAQNVSWLENEIFYGVPSSILSTKELSSYKTGDKIQILIKHLREKGVLIAQGSFGGSFYESEPFLLKSTMRGSPLYGWEKGAKRTLRELDSIVFVLGAKSEEDKEYVFYTMANFVSRSRGLIFAQYEPSKTDKRVYIVSNSTFQAQVKTIFQGKETGEVSSGFKAFFDGQSKILEEEYVKKLCALTPLPSIVDMKEGEAACKKIGQEIFDLFKERSGGDTFAGKEAMQKICDAISSASPDGKVRKQYIALAWDNVGDKEWHWMH